MRRPFPTLPSALLLPALLAGITLSIADGDLRTIPPHASAGLPPPTISSLKPSGDTLPLHPALQEEGIREAEQILTNQILSFLPSFCTEALETFVVRYESEAHRGLGGGNTMIVKGLKSPVFPTGIPPKEYVGIIAHECAHLFVSANRGTPSTPESAFRDGSLPIYSDSTLLSYFRISWNSSDGGRLGDTRENHCSGYGYETDPHEDLSECFVLATLHERTFKQRAAINPMMAAKLAWISEHMLSGFTPLEGFAWDGEVPWDTTKLSHEFFETVGRG